MCAEFPSASCLSSYLLKSLFKSDHLVSWVVSCNKKQAESCLSPSDLCWVEFPHCELCSVEFTDCELCRVEAFPTVISAERRFPTSFLLSQTGPISSAHHPLLLSLQGRDHHHPFARSPCKMYPRQALQSSLSIHGNWYIMVNGHGLLIVNISPLPWWERIC